MISPLVSLSFGAECDKLRRDGYRSSQYYSQGPTFSSSSSAICGSYQDDYEEIEQKVMVGTKYWKKYLPGAV